jgi:hypothetical protein
MDSPTPPDGEIPLADKVSRGVGSSGGRLLAALARSRAMAEANAPAGANYDAEEQELVRAERAYRARKERERMFEERARVLEALLRQ